MTICFEVREYAYVKHESRRNQIRLRPMFCRPTDESSLQPIKEWIRIEKRKRKTRRMTVYKC
jgi:hypothetical protein